MSQSQKLEIRQGQSLVMTAQLQQSIKLLQLSSLELAEYIDQEMEKNPLLMVEEESDAAPVAEESQPEADSAFDDIQQSTDTDNFEVAEWEGTGEQDDWQPEISPEYNYKISQGSEDEDFFERIGNREKSLREHLLDQLYTDIEDPVKRMIGLHIIDMVDENGYVGAELAQLPERIGCEQAEMLEVLALLQRFDPVGA